MGWIANHLPNERGRLVFQVIRPAAHLQKQVVFYWLLKCDKSVPTIAELMIPDGLEEIIFSYGGEYHRVSSRDSTQRQVLTESYVVPLKNTGLLCSRINELNMIGIKLVPGSLYHLLKTSLGSLFNKTLPVSDINHSCLGDMEHELYDAASPYAIKKLLDESLSRLFKHCLRDALTTTTVHEIFLHSGNVSIGDIKQKAGCHYRTLEKRFKERIGCTPKNLSRNIRFNLAFHAMQEMERETNSENIHRFGYYDTSHFYRDFKFFTGALPNTLLCKDLSTEVINASNQQLIC